MPRISDIMAALETWAPAGSQQSYDNVGLQVGEADAAVSRCIISLDLTPAVVDEAVEAGAQLIITHHPLIFRPLKSVTSADWHGSLILRMARESIALFCIHTNLDAAKDGVSFALGKQLGLEDLRFLRPMRETTVKLVTFVPRDHFDTVRDALASAGAGRIGNYDSCAFTSDGTGYFRPNAGANPYIGENNGRLESAPEVRLETEVSRYVLPAVIAALNTAHPYEEIAYDIYPVEQPSALVGMGALGTLPEPELLSTFLARAATALGADGIRYVGDLDKTIQTVAVCGGSGSDLIRDALRAGADAYLTADITYHRFFDVLDTRGDPRMALIDVMHYETEACTEQLLTEWLSVRFPDTQWRGTNTRTSPIATFLSDR